MSGDSLGQARFSFSDEADVTRFVDTLARYERGEIDADAWRAFRLVNGTYGQRQEGTASMLRAKIPQGILSAEQMRVLADVAERHSRGFLHLTTRQNVQLHFIPLAEIGEAMATLARAGLTTREACGNSVRNVTTSPTAGVAVDEVFDPVPYAEAFTRHFLRHPLASSLPRKFKVAFSGGGKDHAFATVNDIGFFAAFDPDGRRGFRVLVAGGTATLVASGRELYRFLPAGEILGVAEALLQVFHEKGDRVHRHKNRMKFLVKQLGWEAFSLAYHAAHAKVAVSERGIPELPFDPARPEEATAPASRTRAVSIAELRAIVGADPIAGPGILPRFLPVFDANGATKGVARFARTNVAPQRQPGFSTVTVAVPLGDLSAGRLRALARLAEAYADGAVRTTPTQNLVFLWVPNAEVPTLFEHLAALGLGGTDPVSLADVGSCPGAESCKLAVTQSRGLGQLLNDTFVGETELLDRYPGLEIRMSGCPNGCGLHHVAGLGFQGGMRKVGGRPVPQYFIYVGGDASGQAARFGRLAAKVPARRVPEAVRAILALYDRAGAEGESITDFLGRVDVKEVKKAVGALETLEEADAKPEDFVDLGETEAFRPEATEGECAA